MSRIIVVSNRLPVTVVYDDADSFRLVPSAGGLATGIGSMNMTEPCVWVGWPGQVHRSHQASITERLRSSYECEPVFLSERLVDKFYEGFSNRTLWPILHSFQSYAKYSASEWNAYEEANRRFLQALDSVIRPGDKVWIHDYQLMLLPKMLRERHPEATIGFFLHIPFPSFDVFRLLPQSRAILDGLLGADLIGFHTDDYARSFLNSIHRAFGIEDRLGVIDVGGRCVQTIVHPMGIDFERFSSAECVDSSSPETSFSASLNGLRSVFSVSRLDYTKGILQSIESFELYLQRHPEERGKVAYVLAVVPSREKVERYAHLKREIDEAVGRINAKHGTLDWQPIRYIYRNLSFEELVELYKIADVAVVCPLRDGMNLVAKEFVASRDDEQGVLILSEMAGAAKELLEAIVVNPNSREELCEALEMAFRFSPNERRVRMKALRERLLENPVHDWGGDFVEKMTRAKRLNARMSERLVEGDRKTEIAEMYASSKRRLFVLDYDGTLMPFMGDPKNVVPDGGLTELIRRLSTPSENDVVILSGRCRSDLQEFFRGQNVTLGAEHGAYLRRQGEAEWLSRLDRLQVDWKPRVRETLEAFVDKIPGSRIEEKDYSLVWHYRRADRESSGVAAKELAFHLLSVIGESPIRIVPGNRSIEVRCLGIGKGAFVTGAFDLDEYDFVLAAGDDVTDEDLFAALPPSSISVRVGGGESLARYRVRDQIELRRLLQTFNEADSPALPIAETS